MRISVGPAPSHWGAAALSNLYGELAHSPVDYVYLGETACARRSCFTPELVGRVRDDLSRCGKRVFASSLVLLRREEQYRSFSLLAHTAGRVEINSPAFLGLARLYPAVAGQSLNVCNSVAAQVLARHGVERIVLPCEMSLESISIMADRCGPAIEVVVHGHVPIAVSPVCLTRRSLNGDGEACSQQCRRYPSGMVLHAGEQPLFRIEGPRTLSAGTHCLVESLGELERAGVDTIRILPQPNHTARIVGIYRDVLDGRRSRTSALEELRGLCCGEPCNGWLFGKGGWTYESRN